MKSRYLWLLLCVLFYLSGVVSYSWYNYHRENTEALAAIDQRLNLAARTLVDVLGSDYHAGIWDKTLSDEEFLATTQALSRLADHAGLTYVYSMVEKDSKIFFTASSATAEELKNEDFSSFMDPCPDASPVLKKSMTQGVVAYDTSSDQWGTFRSVFIPQTASDGTRYTVGADLSVDHLQLIARQSLIRSVLTGLAFVVLIAPLGFMLRRFAAQDKRMLEDRITSATSEILTLNTDLEQRMHEVEREAEKAKAAMEDAEAARREAERARREGMLEAAEKLREVVAGLTTASDALAAQIAESSQGSQLQAGRMGEAAVAMEEMNTTVLEVARNASQAAATALDARSKAQQGAQSVSRVVDEIVDLERRTMSLTQDMQSLGSQAEGIGRIMGVISDIADQTNLLALNAAIEAARAGDAGRGFAVVADEVRKLAEKTMNATKEVGDAISRIQATARQTVDSVARIAGAIDGTAVHAGQSGQELTHIVDLVDQATDQIRAIATASEEQSATSEEITRNIEDVNAISLETSTSMHEARLAVTELARQTQAVSALIVTMRAADAQ